MEYGSFSFGQASFCNGLRCWGYTVVGHWFFGEMERHNCLWLDWGMIVTPARYNIDQHWSNSDQINNPNIWKAGQGNVSKWVTTLARRAVGKTGSKTSDFLAPNSICLFKSKEKGKSCILRHNSCSLHHLYDNSHYGLKWHNYDSLRTLCCRRSGAVPASCKDE